MKTFLQGETRTLYEHRQKARKHWLEWRLIINTSMTKADVFTMDNDELIEANCALDIHIEQLNKNDKRG